MEEQDMIKAKKVYDAMVAALKKKDWKFVETEGKELAVISEYHGEDLKINFTLKIDPDWHILQFYSKLPFIVGRERRFDVAIAVCAVNYSLVCGCFDYNIDSGQLIFRLSSSFSDCEVGDDFFWDTLAIGLMSTDKFNEKFLMLCKNVITLEDFIKDINQ